MYSRLASPVSSSDHELLTNTLRVAGLLTKLAPEKTLAEVQTALFRTVGKFLSNELTRSVISVLPTQCVTAIKLT